MSITGSLVSIVNPVVTNITRVVTDKYKIIRCYDENLRELYDEVKKLEVYKSDIDKSLVRRNEEAGEEASETTRKWIKEVQKLLNKDEKLKRLIKEKEEVDRKNTETDDDNNNNESCFGFRDVVQCGVVHRYKSSRRAEEKVNVARKLYKERPRQDNITTPLTSQDVKSLVESYISQSSYDGRLKQFAKKVNNNLLDDRVGALGVYGDEGVGKSEMMRKVLQSKDVKDKFKSHIVRVVVSENPNIKAIQNMIIEKIPNLLDPIPEEWRRWRSRDSVEVRAIYLYYGMKWGDIKKILLVMDNVEGKVDLSKLGDLYGENFFKLVVVSRTKEVCKSMGVEDDYIHEMTPLEEDEATSLFWKLVCDDEDKIIDQVTTYKCIHYGNNLLKYCQGSPSAITSLAKALRNKPLSRWKEFLKDLSANTENPRNFIWKDSIKRLIDAKEKASFYFLTCLFPPETSIHIQELIRFAMGLDLIQPVDNLTQATILANTWVDQLISDSLLEDDDDPEIGYYYNKSRHVILNHFARESAIFWQEKENGQMIWVKNINRWVTRETLQEYNRISLTMDYNHSYLNGITSEKLEMLILDSSKPSEEFSDDFFDGMINLKVLVLKGMKLKPCLPTSIKNLNKLRTFHLEKCELENMGDIGELENLVVLSLRDSEVREFPTELSKLGHLRVLDLSNCKIFNKGIPAKVLQKLEVLEGLYLHNCCEKWGGSNKTPETPSTVASLDELNELNHLNVLEIKVEDPLQLPETDRFVRNLDQFYVCVGSGSGSKLSSAQNLSHVLDFGNIDVSSIITKYKCLKKLVKKTEFLRLHQVTGELQQILHDEGNGDESKRKQSPKLPCLLNLQIKKCSNMQPISSTRFTAPNLIELRVSCCDQLKFLFLENSHDQGQGNKNAEFPSVTLINLSQLNTLESVSGIIDCSTSSNNDLQGWHHTLFNGKIIFPSLKELGLEECNKIVKLWDDKFKDEHKDYYRSFANLKMISLVNCDNLKGRLASLSMAVEALEQLNELRISNCPLEQVISEEETVEEEHAHHESVEKLFPRLVTLTLDKCPALQMFLSVKNRALKLRLPSLRTLEINNCPKMQSFSSGDFEAPKLKYAIVDERQLSTMEIEAGLNAFLQTCFQNHNKPS